MPCNALPLTTQRIQRSPTQVLCCDTGTNPDTCMQILTLHVIEGAVFAGDLTDGMVVPTLSGEELTVGVSDSGVTFTSGGGVVATVVMADIAVCSSVVHIIDSVLLP